MKIWIHIDGEPQGPYDLDSLPLDRIDADTPVWHVGLADWVAAMDSPVVRPLLVTEVETPCADTPEPADAPEAADQQPAPEAALQSWPQPAPAASAAVKAACEPAPVSAPAASTPVDGAHTGPATTYLLPTLIISLVTFNLVGIVPLIMGLGVRRRNRRQAYDSAWSLSQCTAWWVMITIVVSLMIPFSMLI